jgi:hypothetical protein
MEKSKLTDTAKHMLIIFFGMKGIVHKYLSYQAKQSILHTAVMFYGDCMKLCEDIALNFCDKKNWLLHHNNKLSHTSFFTREFLTKNNMTERLPF